MPEADKLRRDLPFSDHFLDLLFGRRDSCFEFYHSRPLPRRLETLGRRNRVQNFEKNGRWKLSQGHQFSAEQPDMPHFFFDDVIEPRFPHLIRNGFFHTEVKHDGILFGLDGRLQNALQG